MSEKDPGASVFEAHDYKEFVLLRLKSGPRKGFGQMSRLAAHLQTSSVTISQIFRGARALNLDQALLVSEFLELDSSETRYFLKLVERDEARTPKLRSYLEKELSLLKAQRKDLSKVVQKDLELSAAQKAQFYSDWSYSAVRLLATLPGVRKASDISQKIQVDLEEVKKILEFLEECGLLLRQNNGWTLGAQSTHLEADSPLIKNRQVAWRLKAFQEMEKKSEEQLFYTAPMSLSEKDYGEFRGEVVKLISKLVKRVSSSKEETVACFNIDLFKL
jgi:uncharacterized protein (TIGR02147 family)